MKIAAGFAVVGLLVAIVVISATYYEHSHHTSWAIESIPDIVLFLLFPMSVGLMVTEHASATSQIFICTMVTLMNGVWYGLLGLGLSRLFAHVNRKATS
jgi:hypothetical protein